MSSQQTDTDIQILKKDIDIDKEDVLGRGGFGCVFAGYMKDGNKVAVKLLIDQGSIPKRNVLELRREARRLKELSLHCSIIDLCGVLLEPDSYGLVLEYMHFGSSIEFVRTFKVDLPILLRMTCQVASAMMHLHSYDPPILHLDLKADNVLIDKWFNAKVCDFGLSEWKTVTKMVTQGGSAAPRRCTITHIAPEIFKDVNQKSTKQLDIYAFGITVWELFAAQRPYENKSEDVIRHAVCDKQRPDLACLGPDCPAIIKLMINKCWQDDPNIRPAFKTTFSEMERTFEDHKGRLNHAVISIRKQICQKYAVNDPEYLDTEYIDGEIGVEPADTDCVPMETGTLTPDPQGEGEDEENMEEGEERMDNSTVLKPSPPLKYGGRQRQLSQDDIQLRRLIRNPLALEMVRSGLDNVTPLSPQMREIVRDPVKLRDYINNDPSLRSELLQSGSPLLSKLHTPSVRDNSIQGKNEQCLNKKLGKLNSPYHLRDYANVADLPPEERRRLSRAQAMRNCSYTSKLMKNGVGEKLLKVLRDPSKLQTAVESNQANAAGGPQKFETLDRSILDAAQDPLLLQILVTQDRAMMDNLMMYHSDMIMKLISANKTSHNRPSSTSSARSTASISAPQRNGPQQSSNGAGISPQNPRGMPPPNLKGKPQSGKKDAMQDFDLSQLQHMRMGHSSRIEDNTFPTPVEGNSPPEHKGGDIASGLKTEDSRRENKKPGIDKQDKKDIQGDRAAENQRKMQELIAEAHRRRDEESERNKRREEEGRRRFEEEERRKKVNVKQEVKMEDEPSGAVGGFMGLFRGSHNKSRFEIPPARMPIPEHLPSLVFVDQHSLEEDELTGPGLGTVPPVRSHANPLAPRPEPTPNPPSPVTLHRPPDTDNRSHSYQEPTVKQESTSGLTHNQSNHASGGMSSSRENPSPRGGATGGGGVRGGATEGGDSKNITISHAHAGGGFSHISINRDMENLPNIQVGNRNVMVIGGNDTDSDEPGTKEQSNHKKKKTRHREIKLPDQPVDMDRLDVVCTGIGKDWKKLCRALGLDDALIEQIHQDYHINGIYEVMYQALHKWLQKNGKAATIRALGEHLSSIGRDDLVKKIK